METDYLMAAFRDYIFGEAGTGHRWHYTKNVAGAVKGTDGLWICGKEILWGIPALGGIFAKGDCPTAQPLFS